MPKFTFGWKRQNKATPKNRLFVHKTASNPAVADLTPGMGPLLNQGGMGACGLFTATECLTYDQIAQGIKPPPQASELFLYYWVRQVMGTFPQDSGVDNASLMHSMAKYGTIPLSMWPYDDTALSVVPTAEMNTVGLANQVTQYAGVIQDLEQMKATLASLPGDPARPFIFGFNVFAQIQSDQAAANGILASPAASDTPIGGHDVSICAYNAGSSALPGVMPGNSFPPGYFRFRNHWVNGDGSPWGDGGYGYVPFDYATGPQASDFYVINVAPNGGTPSPSPTPTPTPTPTGPTVAQVLAYVDALWLHHRMVSKGQIDAAIRQAFASAGMDMPFAGVAGGEELAFAMPSINWQGVLAFVEGLVQQVGPYKPEIVAAINASSLPTAEKALAVVMINVLLPG